MFFLIILAPVSLIIAIGLAISPIEGTLEKIKKSFIPLSEVASRKAIRIKLKTFLMLFSISPERWISDNGKYIYYSRTETGSVEVYSNFITQAIIYYKIKNYKKKIFTDRQKKKEIILMSELIALAKKDIVSMEEKSNKYILESLEIAKKVVNNLK